MKIFVRHGSFQQGVGFLTKDCKLPEGTCVLRQTEKLGMCHLLPQGLEIESVKFGHETCKCHCNQSIMIYFHPVGDPMIIEAVKNFGDLLIIANIFVIENFTCCLFEIMHDFNRDVASSDGRAF